MNDYCQHQVWRTGVVIHCLCTRPGEKQNKTEKKKETKTVGGELLLLETVGHKALEKTEKQYQKQPKRYGGQGGNRNLITW